MSLKIEALLSKIEYAELHLTKAEDESPETEDTIRLSNWLDDAYMELIDLRAEAEAELMTLFEEPFEIDDKLYIRTPSYGFSERFDSFLEWHQKTTSKTSAYQKRIQQYMFKHPGAPLKEARGH